MAAVQNAGAVPTGPTGDFKSSANVQPVSVMPALNGQQQPPSYQQPPQVQQVSQPQIQQHQQPLPIPAQNWTNEKAQPLAPAPPGTTVAAVTAATAAAAAAAPDGAVAADAVRMAYVQYMTLTNGKDEASHGKVPPKELASRGVTPAEYTEVLGFVRQIKSKSDNNKIMLWTGTIFFLGVIGYLLVSMRAVGNKPLRKQLEQPLEDFNRKLMNRGVPVRFIWNDGSLRAYYK